MSNKALDRRQFMKVGAAGVIGSGFSLSALGSIDTQALERTVPEAVRDQLNMDLVPVAVDSVVCNQPNNIPVVQLSDADGRQLHIYVGVAEGNAIRMGLDRQSTPRPMTHDLMSSLIGVSNMEVACCVITKLEQTTFYATLVLDFDGDLQAVDSRPSDAMALCLRTGSPIYASRALFDS